MTTANDCSSPTVSAVAIGESTLPNPAAKILRCKPIDSGSSSIVRVTVEVEYGDDTPKRKVVHASYTSP